MHLAFTESVIELRLKHVESTVEMKRKIRFDPEHFGDSNMFKTIRKCRHCAFFVPSSSLSGRSVGHKMKSDTENKMSPRRRWTNQRASLPVFTAVFLVNGPITAESRAEARRSEGGT